jgi:hypothetical protein
VTAADNHSCCENDCEQGGEEDVDR